MWQIKNGSAIAIDTIQPIFIVGDDCGLIFEGWARVIERCALSPFWHRVRFLEEQLDRIRFVMPTSLHNDPTFAAEALNELLRTRGLNPWSEFFPEAHQPRRSK